MAVVQISRIQVRRGQKNQGSGIPQLAGGEFGFAVDTSELFIGNGSVTEGAPQVGNTKVLTENDNLFTLADTYSYKANDAYVVTGTSASNPVQRSLQSRLDDIVSVKSFNANGIASEDVTAELQQALDQLYLNSATKGTELSRVALHFEAGVYTISDTIYIPPNATLIGAGIDKTIIKTSTINKPIFQTINDSSTAGSYAADSTSTTLNQARNITIKGMTLESTVINKSLVLQSCTNSVFQEVKCKGPWESGDSIQSDASDDIGLELNSLSGSVESSYNSFVNCVFEGFSYGVISNWDINNNYWERCIFKELGYGVVFGKDTILNAAAGSGTQTGPRANTITNSHFNSIDVNGIWIEEGVENQSTNNYFDSVGNAGGTEGQPQYGVIKYSVNDNHSTNDKFTRSEALSYNQTYINTTVYVPEIEGAVNYQQGNTHKLTIGTGLNKLFRLPGDSKQSFEIEYLAVSASNVATWTGKLVIQQGTNGVSISDDFNYRGSTSPDYSVKLKWSVTHTNENSDLTNDTINVYCTSSMPSGDQTQFEFRVLNRKSLI